LRATPSNKNGKKDRNNTILLSAIVSFLVLLLVEIYLISVFWMQIFGESLDQVKLEFINFAKTELWLLFPLILFVYIFQNKIVLNKLKYFFLTFLILFIFSPMAYFYISITQTDKRTDYPGKRISKIVQEKWENNFINKIELVGGDEWHGGNLSYHLKSRPTWDNILEAKKTITSKDIDGGFVLIGNADILLKICSGIFFEAETQGICMIGTKK